MYAYYILPNMCAYVNMNIQAAAIPYLDVDHKVTTRCLPCDGAL